MRSGRLRIAIAGGNDEVWETVVSARQVHMTFVGTFFFGTLFFGTFFFFGTCGKNMLDVCYDLTLYYEYRAMVDTR